MPKLATLAIETWPRQQGATKCFLMEVMKAAVFEQRKVALVVLGNAVEYDLKQRLTALLTADYMGASNPDLLPEPAAFGIDFHFQPPTSVAYDKLFVYAANAEVPYSLLQSYVLNGIDVQVLRVYDEEVKRYV